MRRLLAIVVLVVLTGVCAGAALAARGDPRERFTPADQARAKAMLLRQTDLPPSFKGTPGRNEEQDFYCKALDESDLTLGGEGTSPDFEGGLEFVSSLAQVYATVADANASWRRGTSAAGIACARSEFRRVAAAEGLTLVAFRRIAFPRVAQRSFAFRIGLRGPASAGNVLVTLDLVALQHGRAHAQFVYGSAVEIPPRAEEVRLARVLAGRMATTMRG